MKCEDFLKQWYDDDNLSDQMEEHLSVCESCKSKVKNYTDILFYIKDDKYPHTINVVENVMQKIEGKTMNVAGKADQNNLKHLIITSLSMAATVMLILIVGWKVGYNNKVQLKNEDITTMLVDVYGYDQTGEYTSFNQLDAIEFFLESYEV